MPRKSPKKTVPLAAISSYERMKRWLTCQQIGQAFYHSYLSTDQIELYKKFFHESDFIGRDLPKLENK